MTEKITRIIQDSGDYIDVEITHVETQITYFATLSKVEYNTRLFREKLGKKLRDEFDELVDDILDNVAYKVFTQTGFNIHFDAQI